MSINIIVICIKINLLRCIKYLKKYIILEIIIVLKLEEIANPFNKIMLNEYIYNEYKYKYGYKRKDNIHYLNTTDKSILRINNYNIKIETENNYSIFFNDINNYNNNLFVCDFENMDYFWLSKLNSLQNNNLIVQ